MVIEGEGQESKPVEGAGEDQGAKELETLRAENAKYKAAQEEKDERLDELNRRVMELQSRPPAREPREEDAKPSTEELEELAKELGVPVKTLKGLSDHIVTSIRKDLGKVGKAIDGEFAGLRTEIEDIRTAAEIDRVAARYEDFWDYKDQMLAATKKNPSLTPLEAYKQVKFEHLEKADKDRKAADAKLGRRVNTEKPGGVASASTKQGKTTGFADAFERAWNLSTNGGE